MLFSVPLLSHTLSQVSQPGQFRLRPSNEHCFIVRVPGAKGCLAVRPFPYCHPDKIFSAIFFYFPQLVTGWRDGRISFYCAHRPSTF